MCKHDKLANMFDPRKFMNFLVLQGIHSAIPEELRWGSALEPCHTRTDAVLQVFHWHRHSRKWRIPLPMCGLWETVLGNCRSRWRLLARACGHWWMCDLCTPSRRSEAMGSARRYLHGKRRGLHWRWPQPGRLGGHSAQAGGQTVSLSSDRIWREYGCLTDTSLMPPRTAHAVYSLTRSVARGSVYYLANSYDHTLFGMLEEHVAGLAITNTADPAHTGHLFRLWMYYQRLWEVNEARPRPSDWPRTSSARLLEGALITLSQPPFPQRVL